MRRASERTPRRRAAKSTRRGATEKATTQARTDQARHTKDELDDALGELNQSTNRLRRKFDPTPNYMETRVQIDRVMDDARRVNQIMVRGAYGTQPERLWAALRASINDLARCYGLAHGRVGPHLHLPPEGGSHIAAGCSRKNSSAWQHH
jgi:hypothetical protein